MDCKQIARLLARLGTRAAPGRSVIGSSGRHLSITCRPAPALLRLQARPLLLGPAFSPGLQGEPALSGLRGTVRWRQVTNSLRRLRMESLSLRKGLALPLDSQAGIDRSFVAPNAIGGHLRVA